MTCHKRVNCPSATCFGPIEDCWFLPLKFYMSLTLLKMMCRRKCSTLRLGLPESCSYNRLHLSVSFEKSELFDILDTVGYFLRFKKCNSNDNTENCLRICRLEIFRSRDHRAYLTNPRRPKARGRPGSGTESGGVVMKCAAIVRAALARCVISHCCFETRSGMWHS